MMVAGLAAAGRARIGVGHNVALGAKQYALFKLLNTAGKAIEIDSVAFEQIKHEPLGRPWANTRQFGKFIYRSLERFWEVGHGGLRMPVGK
jgi:hypothetical protein